MLRRVYWKIAATLIATTAALLMMVGFVVYVSLNQLVLHDEEAQLNNDAVEVQDIVHFPKLRPLDPTRTVDYEDEFGQHVSFLVYQGQHIAVKSKVSALPPLTVMALGSRKGFDYLTYHGRPYRMRVQQYKTQSAGYFTMAIYKPIVTEERLMGHVIWLISLVGGAGFVLAIAFNLWISDSALRPARRLWDEHQHMLVELSHELQTPLATMHAIANQVEKPALRDRLRQETMNASDLVANILYWSKLRVLPKQSYEPVAVTDVTEEVVERMKPLAERRGIRFSGQAQPGLYVLTSTEAWGRMASTLFKNVVDHAEENSTARWSLRQLHGQVELVISNPIDPPDQPMAENGAPGRFGMTIIRRLAASMDGQIQIEAKDGVFRVEVIVPILRPD